MHDAYDENTSYDSRQFTLPAWPTTLRVSMRQQAYSQPRGHASSRIGIT